MAAIMLISMSAIIKMVGINIIMSMSWLNLTSKASFGVSPLLVFFLSTETMKYRCFICEL